MKPIKLTEGNINRVQSAIDAAQGARCTARVIEAGHVYSAIRSCERRLAELLHKKDWHGLRFACEPHAQHFPNAYRFVPESTGFVIERRKTAWYLLSVTRGRCDTRSTRPLNFTEKAQEMARFLTGDF